MTELPFEPDVPVSEYGARRRQEWLRRLSENSAMAQGASLQAYAQSDDRRVTQSGRAGLFGHMTPEEKGEAAAARAATVGSEYGRGRPLERQGGTFDPTAYGSSPAPARVDLRHVGLGPGQRPTGESGLAAYMRTREQ